MLAAICFARCRWQEPAFAVGANGQFLFADQSALDRFNAALNAVTSTTTKLTHLDAERKQLEQAQQEGWKKCRQRNSEMNYRPPYSKKLSSGGSVIHCDQSVIQNTPIVRLPLERTFIIA